MHNGERPREKKLFEVQRMVYNVCSGDVQALKVPQATGEIRKKKESLKVTYFLKHLDGMLKCSCVRMI